MGEGDVRHDQKEEGQAEVEDLRYRAIDVRQRSQVFPPVEDTPKEKVEDCDGNMKDAACEKKG
jgi:hypothetical protein